MKTQCILSVRASASWVTGLTVPEPGKYRVCVGDACSAKWDKLLYAAQCGEQYPSVKSLKGFGGRAVLEIVAPHEGNTYRAVYTVRFHDPIYVLHAFQKKSKKGIATPQKEVELVAQRLAAAERDHRERQN